MALRPIMEKTWNRNILFSALVELTYRCNLDCFYCYNDLGLAGTPLSDEEYFSFFQDLAQMQVMNLTFTGGEPLAHPTFLTLGSKARELGFVVRIKSNGHALRGRLAREIREQVDPFIVEISLHGAEAATHDRQTRMPGSFDRLLENLAELRSLGYRVKLNSTLTRWNETEFEAMFDLADSLEFRLSISPTVTPRDDGDTSPLSIAPSAAAVTALYRFLDDRVPDSEAVESCNGEPSLKKNCGAGASGIAVDPYGNVYPCVQWRRSLGNLHEISIRDIWSGSKELEEVRSLNVAAKRQLIDLGDEAEGLSHCLGISEEKTGDPLALDPQAVEHAQLLKQAQGERRSLPIVQ